MATKREDDDPKAAPKAGTKEAPAPIGPTDPYPTGAPYYPPTQGVPMNEAPPEEAPPPPPPPEDEPAATKKGK